METTSKTNHSDFSNSTVKSLKAVAVLSSALSVVYTVLLASRSTGEGSGAFAVGLSVALAVCFESAKYAFMYAGFDLGKGLLSGATGGSKVVRLLGAALFTISICISILSVAATQQYIDSTSELNKDSKDKTSQKEFEQKVVALSSGSLVLRENEKTLHDVADKIEATKARVQNLLDEKQQLLESGMLSKASALERTIGQVSGSLDSLVEKREEIVGKQEDEIEKIKSSVRVKESVRSVGGNTTVVLAIVLEIVSLFSVAVYSLLTKAAPVPPLTSLAEPLSGTQKVAKLPRQKAPAKQKAPEKTMPAVVEVLERKMDAFEFPHAWVLEALAGEKVTVESVRKAARCSQSNAMRITKEIKQHLN